MKRSPHGGFTLLETLVVLFILGAILLAGSQLFTPMSKFFIQTRARQQLVNDSRITLDTITHTLRQGVANSASYCSCMTAGKTCSTCNTANGDLESPIPNSHVDISLSNGTTSYSIYWVNDNTVQMDTSITTAGAPQLYHTILGRNVVQLKFAVPNSTDLAVVDVMLQMGTTETDGRWNATLDLPPQEVHMTATQ